MVGPTSGAGSGGSSVLVRKSIRHVVHVHPPQGGQKRMVELVFDARQLHRGRTFTENIHHSGRHFAQSPGVGCARERSENGTHAHNTVHESS